jgi:hypothetical protein
MQKLNQIAPFVLLFCGALLSLANYFGKLDKPMNYYLSVGFIAFGLYEIIKRRQQ